jgi:hypothetical protein
MYQQTHRKTDIRMTFSFFLLLLLFLIVFRRNLVGAENAARKLKVHKKQNNINNY